MSGKQEKLERLLQDALGALQQGRFPEAEIVLKKALRLAPGHPYVLHYLGLTQQELGRPDNARRLLDQAMPALRRDPLACYNHATILMQQGHDGEAIELLQQALALAPDYDEAQLQLGAAEFKLGHREAAADSFRKLLARRPDHSNGLINLAGILLDDSPEDAIGYAERAVANTRGKARVAPLNLYAKALAAAGRESEAVAIYEETLANEPDNVRAAFGRAVTLPQVYDSEADIDRWRTHYREHLEEFAARLALDTPARVEAAANAVFNLHNFHLPQQGRDDRAEQEIYGRLLSRIAAARYPQFAKIIEQEAPRNRPRIGFVSAFYRHHSIAKTHGRWATGLDESRFEVYAVHTGAVRDAVSAGIERDVEHFIHHPQGGLPLLELLHGLRLDVIVYPDLGMEPAMLLPAALRLAPVQAQGLGHPITSGLPTMDWAISSAAMEPEGAQAHYSERLVTLPNLSFCYDRDRITAQRGDADQGVRREHDTVFLCSQNLSKLLPGQDEVFARILARVPDSELWLVARPAVAVNEKFRTRLAAACAAHGVAAERVILHPRLDQSAFLALNQAADIFLDGMGWSGCNTTFEAIAMGLPVVTWPGEMMRARHSAAMLQVMGVRDTVAASADDYVAIAARLATDSGWRAAIAANMAEKSPLIYGDQTPIRALEDFLIKACRGDKEPARQ